MAKLNQVQNQVVENQVEAEVKTEATEAEVRQESSEAATELQQLETNSEAVKLKIAEAEAKITSGTLSVEDIIKTSQDILKLREEAKTASTKFETAKTEAVKAEILEAVKPIIEKYGIKRMLYEDFSYTTKDATDTEVNVTVNRFALNHAVEAFTPTFTKKSKATSERKSTTTADAPADFKYAGTSRVKYIDASGNILPASAVFNTLPEDFRKSQFGTATNGSWNRILETANKAGLLTEYKLASK